jgi:two-component system sensor histidine kinase YesM
MSGWTLVKKIPNHTLYLRSTRLTQINAVITGTALLLVIVATLWISIKITEPIKRLTRYINQIQSAGRTGVAPAYAGTSAESL